MTMETMISKISSGYRLGFDLDGNLGMFYFMSELSKAIQENRVQRVNVINWLIAEMYIAQRRADYILMADLLEGELRPFLQIHAKDYLTWEVDPSHFSTSSLKSPIVTSPLTTGP